jgi:hypothetical protein
MNSIKIHKLLDNKFYANKERIEFDTSYIAFIEGQYIKNSRGEEILIVQECENDVDDINSEYIYNTVLTDKIMYKLDVILCENIVILVGGKLYDYIGRELILSGIENKFFPEEDSVVIDYGEN